MAEKDQIDITYSTALIHLMRGVVYSGQIAVWNTVLSSRTSIEDYVGKLGLCLQVDESEGYAFLKAAASEEGELPGENSGQSTEYQQLPRLVRRHPLPYDTTLVIVLLREALEQYDAGTADDQRLVISRQVLRDMLVHYFVERADATKQQRRIDSAIKKAVDLDLLAELKGGNDMFEVRRIVKAMVNAEFLTDIKERLKEHLAGSDQAPEETN